MATADAPLWVHPLFLMFLLQVSCSRIYSVLTTSIWHSVAITTPRVAFYVVVVSTVVTISEVQFTIRCTEHTNVTYFPHLHCRGFICPLHIRFIFGRFY